jgi:hypothetical protein
MLMISKVKLVVGELEMALNVEKVENNMPSL